MTPGRWRILPFAAMLSSAGLPLYIHLPQFAGAQLGLSLSTIGVILIAIRVLDFAEDPALGWLVDRYPGAKPLFAALACAGLGAGFLLLFAVPPPIATVPWIVVLLVVIFTAYSLATILIYGQTDAIAAATGPRGGHLGVAAWRESGLVGGVLLAAAAPSVLGLLGDARLTYPLFGVMVAFLALAAGWLSRSLWRLEAAVQAPLTLRALAASGGLWLLGLATVNALPAALTSTLFLFFVSDRLGLPTLAGPYLILFFVAAGGAAPFWARAAARFGARKMLIAGMALTILSFGWAAILPQGAALAFAVICVGSGAALGADLVILPVMFSSVLARAGLSSGQAFGLWAMATKLSLALAAVGTLPLLQAYGYVPNSSNPPTALTALTVLYAILPCGVKLFALAIVLSDGKRLVRSELSG